MLECEQKKKFLEKLNDEMAAKLAETEKLYEL
jgi:hypothetical protein